MLTGFVFLLPLFVKLIFVWSRHSCGGLNKLLAIMFCIVLSSLLERIRWNSPGGAMHSGRRKQNQKV